MSNSTIAHPDFIFAYTRAQAIEDGVFTDATEQAKLLGFSLPVAFSEGVTDFFLAAFLESEKNNRITTFLQDARTAMQLSEALLDAPSASIAIQIEEQEVWCVCGPDDDGSPALTFMFPEER